MAEDVVITMPDIVVMYVDGAAGKPIPDQAPAAFAELEAKLPSLKRRKFYAVVIGGRYRACVAVDDSDDAQALPHPTWTLPGGKFVRRRIADWEQHREMIGPTFAALRSRADSDLSRPGIEFYRSQRELLVLVPVHWRGRDRVPCPHVSQGRQRRIEFAGRSAQGSPP